MSSTLPESAEPKLIDIWMCVHVGILFLVFLVHIMTGLNKKSGDGEKEDTKAMVFEKRKWDMMNSVLELVSYSYIYQIPIPKLFHYVLQFNKKLQWIIESSIKLCKI